MRTLYAAAVAIFLSTAPAGFAGAKLLLPDLNVGQNLQVFAHVEIDGPAPQKEWSIRVTSGDPAKLRLSLAAETAGEPSIVLAMRPGWTASRDFYVQATGGKTTVTYTASAPDWEPGEGKVTLAPSGIVFVRAAAGILGLKTTSGAERFPLKLVAAVLDSNLKYVAPQPVASSISVDVTSSDTRVGVVHGSRVTIAPGEIYGEAEFQPLAKGETLIKASIPAGFSTPPILGTLPATIITPGIAITGEVTIGKDLQIGGGLSLGEHAPEAGVKVTLTSKNPKRLLLSLTPTGVGSECITVEIPPHGFAAKYYLQALASSGSESYEASAPGYTNRTGVIDFAPSGMVMGGPQGPPDEAELFRKEEADALHGFVVHKSSKPTGVTVFAAQLDPKTGRAADLTVQSMRPGVTARIKMKSSDPAVGRMDPEELVIQPGSDRAIGNFVPAGVGHTDISIVSPPGFGTAQNATSLRVIVKE